MAKRYGRPSGSTGTSTTTHATGPRLGGPVTGGPPEWRRRVTDRWGSAIRAAPCPRDGAARAPSAGRPARFARCPDRPGPRAVKPARPAA